MPTVYGVNLSPFVRKVRVALAEKGVQYDLDPVNPFEAGAEYRKISPLGKIPAFRDGDFTLADSSVICAYLERIHPDPALYPMADTQQFAQALWFEEYGDSGVSPVLGVVFFQKIVAPMLLKQESDEALIKKALEENIPQVFDYLEGQLGEADALVGGQFSIGDIGVATAFVNFHHTGNSVDAAQWPKLARYIAAIHARPSFKALIEEELAFFKQAA